MTYFFVFFYPMASATAYGQRPKFYRAEHSAMAEGENSAYGPTLHFHSSHSIFEYSRIFVIDIRN